MAGTKNKTMTHVMDKVAKSWKPNPSQNKFVQEYLVDFNATQAAIRAGYKKNNANVTGSSLLSNPNIMRMIQERAKLQMEKVEITKEQVLRELGRIAFSDVTQFYNEEGQFKDFSELTDDQKSLLASVETFEEFESVGKGIKIKIGETKKIKVWDKMKALEILAKHFGLYSDAPIIPIQANIQAPIIQIIEQH